MKNCIIMLLLMLTGAPVRTQAQVLIAVVFGDKLNTDKLEFGLIVSPSLTNITGLESSVKPGLNLGLYFNFKMNNRLFLSPELIAKSSFGAWGIPIYSTGNDSLDRLFSGGSVQRKIQAMSLPLLIHYRIKGRLFAESGIQIDMRTGAKDNFKAKVGGNQLVYTIKNKDRVNLLDLGITGGILYKFKKDKGMGVGIRYLRGLTDLLKENGRQVNTAWLLNITIPIGGGKEIK